MDRNTVVQEAETRNASLFASLLHVMNTRVVSGGMGYEWVEIHGEVEGCHVVQLHTRYATVEGAYVITQTMALCTEITKA